MNKNIAKLASEFGYKSANLMVRKEHAAANNYEIPPFIPLSHDQIKSLLKNNGIDIENTWNILVNKFKDSLMDAESLNYADAWTKYVNQENRVGLLRSLKNQIMHLAINDNFKKDLQEVLNKDKNILSGVGKLIVRSSGAEDTTISANQGGNESLDCESDISAIATALCVVVVSYFADKSIGQRSVAGESVENLQKLPQLSLLVQKLICEVEFSAASDPTIVSGVAFKPEPMLDCAEILAINCTYGHNRAVVESLLPCDTYYVTPSGRYFASVPVKPARKIAKIKDNIDEVENSVQSANMPCLKAEQIVRLNQICDAIQKQSSHAVDIEWVYDVKQDKFFIVQVRPIPPRKVELDAAYLVNIQAMREKYPDCLKITPMVTGKLYPATIDINSLINKNIIVTRTAVDAYRQYMELSQQQQNEIIGIFIEENVLPTSHEAGFFRQANVSVLQIESEEKFIDSIKKPYTIFQQQRIAIPGNMEQFKDYIQTGLCAYPFGSQLSFSADKVIANELQDYIVKTAKFMHEKGLAKTITGKSSDILKLIEKLQIIKDHKIDFNNIREDIYLLINQINILYASTFKKIQSHPQKDLISQDYKLLYADALKIGECLLDLENNTSVDKKYLLFLLGALEVNLKQQPDNKYKSSLGLTKIMQEVQSANSSQASASSSSDTQLPSSVELAYLNKIGNSIMNEDMQLKWKKFVDDLAKNNDPMVCKRVASIAASYHKNNVLSFWVMNILSVAQPVQVQNLRIFDASKFDLFQKNLQELEQIANNFNLDNLDKINQTVTFVEKVMSIYPTLDNMDKFYVLSLVEKSVDRVDAILKNIKEIKDISVEAKNRLFLEVLEKYVVIFNVLAVRWDTSEELFPQDYVNSIKQEIEKIKLNLSSAEILLPTKGFSAAAILLVNGAEENYANYNGSLENIFTTVHQNMLAMIGKERDKIGFSLNVLPSKIIALAKSILNIEVDRDYGDESSPYMLCVNEAGNSVSVVIVVPLRHHSGVVQINFNKNNPSEIVLKINIYMLDEDDRFSRFYHNGNIVAAFNKYVYQPQLPRINEYFYEVDDLFGDVGFDWIINLNNIRKVDSIAKSASIIFSDTFKEQELMSDELLKIDHQIYSRNINGLQNMFFVLLKVGDNDKIVGLIKTGLERYKFALYNSLPLEKDFFNYHPERIVKTNFLFEQFMLFLLSNNKIEEIKAILADPNLISMNPKLISKEFMSSSTLDKLQHILPEGISREILRRELQNRNAEIAIARQENDFQKLFEHHILPVSVALYDDYNLMGTDNVAHDVLVVLDILCHAKANNKVVAIENTNYFNDCVSPPKINIQYEKILNHADENAKTRFIEHILSNSKGGLMYDAYGFWAPLESNSLYTRILKYDFPDNVNEPIWKKRFTEYLSYIIPSITIDDKLANHLQKQIIKFSKQSYFNELSGYPILDSFKQGAFKQFIDAHNRSICTDVQNVSASSDATSSLAHSSSKHNSDDELSSNRPNKKRRN